MATADTPLARKLRQGRPGETAVSVAKFMDLCLNDPDHGYYRTRDPLGARGDFITAPEISQIFGELIGLWCTAAWRGMGRPEPVLLVELGPGRGTLMSDALRAAKIVPSFSNAIRLHLVETSPVLRRLQKETLRDHTLQWHETVTDLSEGPAIVIANEFLDALPMHQLVRRGAAWRERCVSTDATGQLVFIEQESPPADARLIPPAIAAACEGDVAEVRPAADALAVELGRRSATAPVTALFIDYGYVRSAPGDTLQAVSRHGFAGPLEAPGEHDLTAHVDFQRFAESARAAGLAVHGPLEQGEFLLALGLAARCERLMKDAAEDQARAIESGAKRLVDPAQMGTLFKVLALTGPGVPAPPPF